MYGNNHVRALKPVAILLLLAITGATSGCLWAPDLIRIRKDIERQLPGVRFEREIELSLGPVLLTFARLVVRAVPAAREAGLYLRDVNRIEVAIYNTEKALPASAVSMPKPLKKLLKKDDWESAVTIRDDNELVWLLYRIDDDSIREVFVVVLSEDELVLVKAEGRLERLIAYALDRYGDLKSLPDSRASI